METTNEQPVSNTAEMAAGEPEGKQEVLQDPEVLPGQEAYESLEKEKQELQRQKEELQREYQRIETGKLLEGCGLPKELLENVMGKDMEETKNVIQAVKAAFDHAVQRRVEERLRGKTPQSGNESSYYGMDLTNQVREALV